MLEVRQHRPELGPGGHGQQLALLHQVAGEEQGERDLGELSGLEADRPQRHPDPRPPGYNNKWPGTTGRPHKGINRDIFTLSRRRVYETMCFSSGF